MIPSEDVEKLMKKTYKEYKSGVINWLRFTGVRIHEAEELFHDSMVVIHRNLLSSRISEKEIKRSYLWGVVRRVRANKFRRKNKPKILELSENVNPLSVDSPESQLIAKDHADLLLKAIEMLNEKCKTILNLYLRNFSSEAIAEHMGWEKAQSAMNAVSKCKSELEKRINLR